MSLVNSLKPFTTIPIFRSLRVQLHQKRGASILGNPRDLEAVADVKGLLKAVRPGDPVVIGGSDAGLTAGDR